MMRVPWTPKSALKHNKTLTDKESKTWAKIANAVLKRCNDNNGSDCEAKAIKVANGVIKRNRKKS